MSDGWLTSRRGRLTPGQVVTAVAPIAQALAEVHARGLAHGRLTAADIHLTAEGRPVLDGVGPSGFGTPQEDVQALADLGLELLTPETSSPVRDALLAAQQGDAAELAEALLAACVAEPLRPAPAVAPVAPRRQRRRWPVVLPVLLAALLVAGHLVRTGRPEWAALLQGLDARRAAAFAEADAALLAGVYAPGSPGLEQDTGRLLALRQRHQTVRGLRHRLTAVRVTSTAGQTVQLVVTAVLAAHEIEGPGAARRVIAAGPAALQHVTLVRTLAGWRVAAVIV